MNRKDIKSVNFNVVKPKPFLPRPIRLMLSVTNEPAYNSVGMIVREECYDFHYTLSGEGVYIYNNKEYPVKKGQGFIWYHDDEKVSYHYNANTKEEWKFISFCFWQEEFLSTIDGIIDEANPVISIPDNEPILKKLNNYFSSEKDIIISCADGTSLVYELIICLISSVSDSKQDFHPLVYRAKKLIESEHSSNLNISQIADTLGVSREYLSRTFKEYTGKNLKEYITFEIINQACSYLSNTNKSIAEISQLLNYSTPSNFTRKFNEIMALTPNQYRKRKKYNLQLY